MAESPEVWFRNLPIVTKVYMCAALATTTLVSFGALSPLQLYIDHDLVIRKFHVS